MTFSTTFESMARLRFRAWDTKAKEMSPPFTLFGEFTLLGAVHAWQSEFSIEGDSLGRLGDLEIMQFTGLKDKNGVEVCEGDIIKMEDGQGYVFYDDMEAAFLMEYYPSYFLRIGCGDEIEILGNKFQHPYLVNVKVDKSIPNGEMKA